MEKNRKPHPNSKEPHTVQEIFLEGDEYCLDGPLDEVIQKLQEIQVAAATVNCQDVRITTVKASDYGWSSCHDIEVTIAGTRLETPQEVTARRAAFQKKSTAAKKAAAKRSVAKEAEERALYEELKKKFGE